MQIIQILSIAMSINLILVFPDVKKKKKGIITVPETTVLLKGLHELVSLISVWKIVRIQQIVTHHYYSLGQR